jgi:predicted PurR-regulated permease PerM
MEPVSAPNSRLTHSLRVLALVALALAIVAFAVWFFGQLSSIGAIVVGSLVLIYLIVPVIKLLGRVMSKHWAVAVTFVGITAVFVLVAAIVIPPLVDQLQLLGSALPEATLRAHSALLDPNNEFLSKLPASIRDELAALPDRFFAVLMRYGLNVGGAVQAMASGVSLLIVFIVIPVLAAYAFFDYPELERAFLGFIPQPARPRTIAIMHDMSDVMGAFVRGQALDALIVGFMIYIWLTLMKVPFALIIAVAGGILNFIPYAGAIVGFIPSVLLALAYNGWQNALVVAIGFCVIQQVDGDFIVPRIMSRNVKLSPVLVIISIIAFGTLFGLLGALIAVPVAAMLRVLKLHFAPSPTEAQFVRDKAEAASLMKFTSR